MIKGKRATITPENEKQIFNLVRKFPNMKRTELAEKIQTEINWIRIAPQIEVLERKISKYRNTTDSIEEPWSLLSISKNNIQPESLPRVLAIFVQQLLNKNIHITVREAIWIARFAFLPIDNDKLYAAALEYANYEKWAEINNLSMDKLIGMPDDLLVLDDFFKAQPNMFERKLSREDMDLINERICEERIKYENNVEKFKKGKLLGGKSNERSHRKKRKK